MHPGRTDEQKKKLVAAIVRDVTTIAVCEEKSVSIAIEEVSSEDWAEKVYKPDIIQKEKTLVKKPGYNPFRR
jgi:4-oxalocrotonate tautomerase